MSGNHNNRQHITDLIIQGHSNAVIASRLNLSVKGVKFHVTKIFKAHNVTSRAQLIAKNSESYNLKLMQSKIDSLTKEIEYYKLRLEALSKYTLPLGVRK